MRRNVSLEEISDGRLYGYNDMVKADCHGCKDCHKCCTGMGNSVILDPYDVWRLQVGLKKNLQQLMEEGKIELHVVDGCILPNLKMAGQEEACAFLDAEGRCSIHAHRPGICRLFPLGRYYENGDFKYFLQVGECSHENRSKVKVSKWIDTPEQGRYHDFLCKWHYMLNDVEREVAARGDEEVAKNFNLLLLQTFYFAEHEPQKDFFDEFEEKWNFFRGRFGI